MNDLVSCINALGNWGYKVASCNIPGINVSFWILFITLFSIGVIFKTIDVFTHRNTGFNDNNNNKIYR